MVTRHTLQRWDTKSHRMYTYVPNPHNWIKVAIISCLFILNNSYTSYSKRSTPGHQGKFNRFISIRKIWGYFTTNENISTNFCTYVDAYTVLKGLNITSKKKGTKSNISIMKKKMNVSREEESLLHQLANANNKMQANTIKLQQDVAMVLQSLLARRVIVDERVIRLIRTIIQNINSMSVSKVTRDRTLLAVIDEVCENENQSDNIRSCI